MAHDLTAPTATLSDTAGAPGMRLQIAGRGALPRPIIAALGGGPPLLLIALLRLRPMARTVLLAPVNQGRTAWDEAGTLHRKAAVREPPQ